jgi:predicted amidohydrolase YtcJ
VADPFFLHSRDSPLQYLQGPERIKSLYAFRSILDYGGRITLGSDMPVEGVNPLAGFYAAITRLTEEGTSPHGPEGWYATFAQILC